jgi:Tol biopolymer transport system component
MRNHARIIAMLLVIVPAGMSHAADDVTRFTGEFVVKTGKPVTEVRKFQGTAGPATLKLYNGADRCSWGKRVSGAWVSVNGVRVFRPSKVTERVSYLQETVTLKEGCNVLKVYLRGKPGAKIRIKIAQQMEACGPTRVSVASDGTQGDDASFRTSISGHGRLVAFSSDASNLVPGDTNEQEDVFVHDRWTGVTERVSVASDGAQGNGKASGPSISAEGRFVAFGSLASNLVPGDTNGQEDVFVHDRWMRVTERVSVASDGTESNHDTFGPSISADGRFVAFESESVGFDEDEYWSNLVPEGERVTSPWGNVFVHDRKTGVTELVSVDESTGEALGYGAHSASISADGKSVAFQASTLDRQLDVYVRDRQREETELITSASEVWEWSTSPSISADGRFVAFQSESSNFVPDDTNGTYDIFVRDRKTGETERVSMASDGAQAEDGSGEPSISGDGRFVAFSSHATNLAPGDTNGVEDVFVHDRRTGETERVSVAFDGAEGENMGGSPWVSGDGKFVAFESSAPNLVPGDTNGATDAFVTCNPLSRQGMPWWWRERWTWWKRHQH